MKHVTKWNHNAPCGQTNYCGQRNLVRTLNKHERWSHWNKPRPMPNPITTTPNSPYDALIILYSKHHKSGNMAKRLLQFTPKVQTSLYTCTMFVIAISPRQYPRWSPVNRPDIVTVNSLSTVAVTSLQGHQPRDPGVTSQSSCCLWLWVKLRGVEFVI